MTLHWTRLLSVLRLLPERWKRRLFEHWMTTSHRYEDQHDWDKAIRLRRCLPQIDPDDAYGWYLLACAHLDSGDPQTALDTIHEAKRTLSAEIPLDLLDLEACAHDNLDNHDELVPLLDEIGDRAPNLAHMLVHDLDLHELVDEYEPDWWTQERADQGHSIDGYA